MPVTSAASFSIRSASALDGGVAGVASPLTEFRWLAESPGTQQRAIDTTAETRMMNGVRMDSAPLDRLDRSVDMKDDVILGRRHGIAH